MVKSLIPSSTIQQTKVASNQQDELPNRLSSYMLEKLGITRDPVTSDYDQKHIHATSNALLVATFPIFFNKIKHDLMRVLTEEAIEKYRKTNSNAKWDADDARNNIVERLWALTDALAKTQLSYALGFNKALSEETATCQIAEIRDSIERLLEETDPSYIRTFNDLDSGTKAHFDKRQVAARCVYASRQAVCEAISNHISKNEPSL